MVSDVLFVAVVIDFLVVGGLWWFRFYHLKDRLGSHFLAAMQANRQILILALRSEQRSFLLFKMPYDIYIYQIRPF